IMAIVVHLDTIHRTMWECLESTDHTTIHFKPFHHNTHYFEPIQKALVARNDHQMGHNVDRKPFTDISSNIIRGDQNELLGPMLDAKERKRKRDRERYAAMSVEQKNEKNRKRREARQRNKGHNVIPNVSGVDDDDEGVIFGEDNDENEGYLFA
ncbi:hypothetical protein ACJX0J_005887, partial [Zea mays]